MEKHSKEVVQAVWERGKTIPGRDPDIHRRDVCSAMIKRAEHGNRDSDLGWEVDHINPNGSDDLSNLRPLQWENNAAKGDNLDGYWTCAVTS